MLEDLDSDSLLRIFQFLYPLDAIRFSKSSRRLVHIYRKNLRRLREFEDLEVRIDYGDELTGSRSLDLLPYPCLPTQSIHFGFSSEDVDFGREPDFCLKAGGKELPVFVAHKRSSSIQLICLLGSVTTEEAITAILRFLHEKRVRCPILQLYNGSYELLEAVAPNFSSIERLHFISRNGTEYLNEEAFLKALQNFPRLEELLIRTSAFYGFSTSFFEHLTIRKLDTLEITRGWGGDGLHDRQRGEGIHDGLTGAAFRGLRARKLNLGRTLLQATDVRNFIEDWKKGKNRIKHYRFGISDQQLLPWNDRIRLYAYNGSGDRLGIDVRSVWPGWPCQRLHLSTDEKCKEPRVSDLLIF